MDIKPFCTWQFVATCCAIYALMYTFKAMGRAWSPLGKLQVKPLFKALVMTPMNVGLGLLFAIPKGFLLPAGEHGRFVLGICAGLLCVFVYTIIKKRIADVADISLPDPVDDKKDDPPTPDLPLKPAA